MSPSSASNASTWVLRRAVRLLLTGRFVLFGLALVLVLAAVRLPTQLDFDRKVVNLIADQSRVLATFRKLKRSFGGNEIVLAVYRDPQLLHQAGTGIDRLTSIGQRLEAIDGVRSTLSLDKLNTRLIPIVSKTNPYARRMRELFEGYTHNASGDIAVVVCMLHPEEDSGTSRRATIEAIREVMHDLPAPLEPGMLTGEPVMLVDGYRYVEQDGRRLSIWSSVLLGVTILVCFRSVRWMLICIGVVQLALLLTRLTMSLLGMRMSMVSSMLTAVATVVGVATVVHLIVRFREARAQQKNPFRAMVQTTTILLVPIMWACVTDAVGFAALQSASVGPVGDFGVMMGISCLAVLVSVWLLVPTLALLGPLPNTSSTPASRTSQWLAQIAATVERRGKSLAAIALAVVLTSVCGLQFLEVETDFTRNFRSDAQIVKAYRFVENNLGGAGVGDILVPAPERLGWEFLRKVRQFEDQIREEAKQADGPLAGVTKVLSLADAVLAGAPNLPLDRKSSIKSEFLTRSGLAVMRARIPSFYDALHAEDPQSATGQHYLRIMFRAREQQSAAQKRALIARMEELGRKYFPEATEPVEVTGFFALLTHLIDNIVGDQWTTFGIAIAGIGLTMLWAFRSLPLAVVALLPNALPVLVVTGCMGWMKYLGWYEFRINMGSAMIAAVSLGLSIDSSIHYLFAYLRARRRGQDRSEAIASAHGTVGLSMICATLALIVGFSVLATSKFTPTVTFGSLVSLAMLGGLLGNLIVLPILLRLADFSTKSSPARNA